MRKAWLAAVLAAFLVLGTVPDSVSAYSPHYLPGGKNYLAADNFERDSGYFTSIENFLVKPNTTYCLTVGVEYYDFQDLEIIIDLFANQTQLPSITIGGQDFTMHDANWYYVVFTTSATANYMDLYFLEPPLYFETHTVEHLQLEEGSVFTGYEAYVEGEVADVNGPYFAGNAVVLKSVDDTLTEPQIRSGLSAIDAVDGDVSAQITVLNDAYTGHGGTLGNYVITYRVADTAGNQTDFQVTVKVVDVTDPFFGGTTAFVAPYPTVLTIGAIKAQVTASDNYDGDLSAAVTLATDGYTANASVLGTYDVVFTVEDASGNVATRTVSVSVVDQTDPIFTGPAVYTIGYDNPLTVADIKAALAVTDDYDADLTASIAVASDGYSAHMKQIGAYTVVFRAVDTSGNETTYNVLVNVVDGIGPVVYVDSSIVRVFNSTVLSLSDFTGLLVRAGELPGAEGYRVTVRYDSYSTHATQPGVYHLALDIVDPAGSLVVKTFQVMVSEPPEEYVPGPGDAPGTGDRPIMTVGSWIATGTLAVLLLASNLVWVLKIKKR